MIPLTEPLGLINEIMTDNSVPKNVRQTMKKVTIILESESERAVKCDKAIQLITLNDDLNIDSFTRTRIWSILSMLESLTK